MICRITVLVFLFSLVGFSQTIEKEFADFDQLKTFDGISVELIPSDTNRAVVTGERKEDVVFVNKNGLLKIRFNLPKVTNQYKTKVKLYYKSLYLIDANEGSIIFTGGTVKEIDLDIKVQEGAIIRLDVESQRVNARVVSGGVITLSGNTKNQDVVVNTGGIYKGKECLSEQTKVSVSAGGAADVYATEIVKANVKAGGSIMIYGNPKLADTKKVLGGSIEVVK